MLEVLWVKTLITVISICQITIDFIFGCLLPFCRTYSDSTINGTAERRLSPAASGLRMKLLDNDHLLFGFSAASSSSANYLSQCKISICLTIITGLVVKVFSAEEDSSLHLGGWFVLEKHHRNQQWCNSSWVWRAIIAYINKRTVRIP